MRVLEFHDQELFPHQYYKKYLIKLDEITSFELYLLMLVFHLENDGTHTNRCNILTCTGYGQIIIDKNTLPI